MKIDFTDHCNTIFEQFSLSYQINVPLRAIYMGAEIGQKLILLKTCIISKSKNLQAPTHLFDTLHLFDSLEFSIYQRR